MVVMGFRLCQRASATKISIEPSRIEKPLSPEIDNIGEILNAKV